MKKILSFAVLFLMASDVFSQTVVEPEVHSPGRAIWTESGLTYVRPENDSAAVDTQSASKKYFNFTSNPADSAISKPAENTAVIKPTVLDSATKEKSLSVINTISKFSNTRVEDEFVVSGELALPAGTSVILAKKLKFNNNAILRIDPSVKFFKLVALESSIGENCKIIAAGKEPGQKGVDLDVFLGIVNCLSLDINTSGAVGATGATGQVGRKGRDASCTGDGAGNGYDGGQGDQGGPGGAGGHITLAISNPSFPNLLTMNSAGGKGGAGGAGGPGGPGGAGKKCGLWKRGSGNQGPTGPSGPVGIDGVSSIPTIRYGETVEGFFK